MNHKVDQSVIKDHTQKKIIVLLQKNKEMIKREIAKKIGVSVPTIISNINELIEQGIVEEAGVASSTGGRKPVLVRFLKNSRYSIGVDLLIGKVRIVVLNLNYDVICDRFFEFDTNYFDTNYKFNDLIDKIVVEINRILETMDIDSKKIIGVGFSLPGTVNEDTKVLEIAANLNVNHVDFNQYSDKFTYPIFVENESNAAAFAEYKIGVCKNQNDMVYISVNKGVGAGVVADNKIYKGYKKRAGELGHMTIHKDGRRCICGKSGCWNAYVSIFGLINEFNRQSGLKIKSLYEFFELYHQDNQIAKSVWKEYISDFSVGIQNILLIFDPHYVVIGGEIANYTKELIEPLKKEVFKDIRFFIPEDVEILTSSLKEDASVMGAALIPINTFLTPSNGAIQENCRLKDD
jgi:predicted NBD/HSP70 family sugar kinase